MDYKFTCLLLFLLHFGISTRAETYHVNIKTDRHINIVDSKFLSFTIDPKFLFSFGEKYKSNECLCMASSLVPAYIRIAGPSTPHLTFLNSTVYIDDQPNRLPLNLSSNGSDLVRAFRRRWSQLLRRAASVGLRPVVALSARPRTATGLWDPNPALDALSTAHRHRAHHVHWQLGYECSNQTIGEYLNDLETLRVIIETFPPGKAGQWKVVAGDVTDCLQAYSENDFRDYITFSNDMMDAIFLNGDSTYRELERMSERGRYELLESFSMRETPLWLTERSAVSSPSALAPLGSLRKLERAMEWLSSLGAAAADGYSVHFRDLEEDELWEPTLSFYMALLYKNLVGRRVLSSSGSSQMPLYSSCASRSRSLVLYAANPLRRPVSFVVQGAPGAAGDVLQYVLGLGDDGNVVVNGRAMRHEGDIRPVVKRVRAYRTLLLNLPAKSFGFWVLANTRVKACDVNGTFNDKFNYSVDTSDDEDENFIKSKRINIDNFTFRESLEESVENMKWEQNKAIKDNVDNINTDLLKYHQKNNKIFKKYISNRLKRQIQKDGNTIKYKKTKVTPNLKSRRRSENQSLGKILYSNIPKFSKDNIRRIKKNIFLKLRDVKRNLELRPTRRTSTEKQTKVQKCNNDIQKSNNKLILNNKKDKPQKESN